MGIGLRSVLLACYIVIATSSWALTGKLKAASQSTHANETPLQHKGVGSDKLADSLEFCNGDSVFSSNTTDAQPLLGALNSGGGCPPPQPDDVEGSFPLGFDQGGMSFYIKEYIRQPSTNGEISLEFQSGQKVSTHSHLSKAQFKGIFVAPTPSVPGASGEWELSAKLYLLKQDNFEYPLSIPENSSLNLQYLQDINIDIIDSTPNSWQTQIFDFSNFAELEENDLVYLTVEASNNLTGSTIKITGQLVIDNSTYVAATSDSFSEPPIEVNSGFALTNICPVEDAGSQIDFSIQSSEGDFVPLQSGTTCTPEMFWRHRFYFKGDLASIAPLDEFTLLAKIVDGAGNQDQKLIRLRRAPVAVQLSQPLEASLPQRASLLGSCSEIGLPVRVLNSEYNLLRETTCLDSGSFQINSMEFTQIPGGEVVNLKIEHSEHASQEVSFVKAVPRLGFNFPTQGAKTEGNPTVQGDCDSGQTYFVDANFTILSVGQGTPVDSQTFECSQNGEFELKLQYNSGNGFRSGNPSVRISDEFDNDRELDLNFSECPGISRPANSSRKIEDSGSFCRVPYWDNNNLAGGVRYLQGDQIKDAKLADPSILKVGDYYYLTGTSDDLKQADFEIYRSKDLINWDVHGRAFGSEPGRNNYAERYDIDAGRDRGVLKLTQRYGYEDYGNERNFAQMWDPHLYLHNGVVYLAFAAYEHRSRNETEDRPLTEQELQDELRTVFLSGQMSNLMSSYLVSIPVDEFVNGGSFADPELNRFHEPTWYGYFSDGKFRYDGGVSLSNSTRPARRVPSTLVAGLDGMAQWGNTFCHPVGLNCNTVMGIGPAVFQDTNGEMWIAYNWRIHFDPDEPQYHDVAPNWQGNHIVLAPLSQTQYLFDTTRDVDLLNLAYYKDDQSPLNEGVPNGCRDGELEGHDYLECIAEGPAIYRAPENGKYILTFSRNSYVSSDYHMVYRIADSVRELGSFDYQSNPPGERRLTQSFNWQEPAQYNPEIDEIQGKSNFAGGMLFTGPGNKTYLVAHRKADDEPVRTIFFANINFQNTNGEISIVPIIDRPEHENHPTDPDYFLVPRP